MAANFTLSRYCWQTSICARLEQPPKRRRQTDHPQLGPLDDQGLFRAQKMLMVLDERRLDCGLGGLLLTGTPTVRNASDHTGSLFIVDSSFSGLRRRRRKREPECSSTPTRRQNYLATVSGHDLARQMKAKAGALG